jgi:hypothetical protein
LVQWFHIRVVVSIEGSDFYLYCQRVMYIVNTTAFLLENTRNARNFPVLLDGLINVTYTSPSICVLVRFVNLMLIT